MSQVELLQGTCERCGVPNRVLSSLPPLQHGCNVCSLSARLQQISSRLDSESDFRYVSHYQDFQDAAERFWSLPPGMLPLPTRDSALPDFPTPVEPTDGVTGVNPLAIHDRLYGGQRVLPSIIPPCPELASYLNPTWDAHTTGLFQLQRLQSCLPLTTDFNPARRRTPRSWLTSASRRTGS